MGSIEAQSPSVGNFDPDAAIKEYQDLITSLPPLNRQLLLYILDLLAVFASKSDLNKMTTPNLAAIFQPGILSHPQHDMAPPEYRLSQDVLIFLIENQDSFLIGMQGTAADADTVRDVQAGTPTKVPATPTTPGRSKTIVGRTSSNASTREGSLRKPGDIRRNVSTSSKHSKQSENGPKPVSSNMSPTTSVHRSNTVPSRREGSSAHSPRFSIHKNSDPSTPGAASPSLGLDTNKPRSESLQATPVAASPPQFPESSGVSSPNNFVSTAAASAAAAAVGTAPVATEGMSLGSGEAQTPKRDISPSSGLSTGIAEQSTDRPSAQTPPTSPGRFLDIFKQSPSSDAEARKPNKLQKKQSPHQPSLSSAQSSNHSLPVDAQRDRSPASPNTYAAGTTDVAPLDLSASPPRQATNATVQQDPSRNLSADNVLRPTTSPSHSYHSGTESDADMVGDDQPKELGTEPEKHKRRHRWRFSRQQNKLDPSPAPSPVGGALAGREQTMSRSTVGSNNARRSFQEPTPLSPTLSPSNTDPMLSDRETPHPSQTFSSTSTDPVFSDSEREKRGPMSWIRGKMRGDKDADKRAKTPDKNRERSQSRQAMQAPTESLPIRETSFENQRIDSEPPTAAPGGATSVVTSVSPGALAAASTAPATVAEESTEEAAPSPFVPLSSDHNGL